VQRIATGRTTKRSTGKGSDDAAASLLSDLPSVRQFNVIADAEGEAGRSRPAVLHELSRAVLAGRSGLCGEVRALARNQQGGAK